MTADIRGWRYNKPFETDLRERASPARLAAQWRRWAIFLMRSMIPLLLVCLLCVAADIEQVVDYDGCEIYGHLHDKAQSKFIIRIRASPYSAKRDSAVKSWWGVDGGLPSEVTTELSLSIGGIQIAIPHRAFADLGDPHPPGSISLMQPHDTVYLYIHGGDGAGSYVAKFFIRDGKLIRREVVPGEFPKEKPQVIDFTHE